MAGIAVLAKPAVPGRVKTRLARRVGPVEAALFAEAFLLDTWSMLAELPTSHLLLASERGAAMPLLTPKAELIVQGAGTLGERLERVASHVLGRHQQVVLLGSDTPHLPASYVYALLRDLQHVDVVMGPAEDGGFWGLAMRRCPRDCLGGVEWSVESTGRQTLEALARAGLSIGLGPVWYDIDEGDALDRMLAEARPDAVPATRALARRLWEEHHGAQ